MSTEHTEPAGLSDEELLQIAEDSCMDLFKRKRRDPDGIAIEEGYWEAWDHQLLAFARAVEAATLARAQRQPVPPEPEEVQELVGLIRQIALAWEPDATLLGNMTAGQLARAADLLESLSPPQPVPLSERLPGPGDCDAEGRCWWFYPEYPGEYSYWILAKEVYCDPTHWRPAHALPLPGEVEG